MSESEECQSQRTPLGNSREGYVFISYKREEVEHANRIRNSLLTRGYNVWWDEDIQCGQAWNEVLDEAVRKSHCIVVLWSTRSMQSRWVMHEASAAIDRGIYTPARIELCHIESPYNRLQATDILDWDGQSDHPGLNDLLHRIDELLPLKRTRFQLLRNLCLANLTTIASAVFACIALSVLGWQTSTAVRQSETMDYVAKEQQEVADSLSNMLAEQRRAAQELNNQQERIRFWAILEIERAICEILAPYVSITDPPEPDDRFRIAGRYQDVFERICDVNLHTRLNEFDSFWTYAERPTYGEALTHHTLEGQAKLHEVLGNYSDILSPGNRQPCWYGRKSSLANLCIRLPQTRRTPQTTWN